MPPISSSAIVATAMSGARWRRTYLRKRYADDSGPADAPRRVGASAGQDELAGANTDILGWNDREAEVARLLESSGGLVPLRGKWVEIDREKLKEALDHWRTVEQDVRRDGITFFEGMRLLSGASILKEEDDEGQAATREWSGLTAGPGLDAILEELRSPDTEQEAAPPGLKAEFRPYQRTGYGWLRFAARLGLGACLADDMGLGKTVQVISLLLDLKRDKQDKASLLVVPASLIANWK